MRTEIKKTMAAMHSGRKNADLMDLLKMNEDVDETGDICQQNRERKAFERTPENRIHIDERCCEAIAPRYSRCTERHVQSLLFNGCYGSNNPTTSFSFVNMSLLRLRRLLCIYIDMYRTLRANRLDIRKR